jgi:radical SAM/Cys-rich protein
MSEYDFNATLKDYNLYLPPVNIETLWVNITHRCNQSCLHCHVNASPLNTEEMDLATINRCLEILESLDSCKNFDITGGAPELHPYFKYLVIKARGLGKHVIVRHNLTVTLDGDILRHEPKDYLPSFFSENQVEVLASLPYFTKDATDALRGEGVFDKSVKALRCLNDYGYGQPGTGLELNLVCNRDGPVSPQERMILESSFRQELRENYGIVFNRLFAVTNMPVNRYLLRLKQSKSFPEYMNRLLVSFDPASTTNLVCRYLVSVGYDGRLYDCDFNQMLGMQVQSTKTMTVFNFNLEALLKRRIRFGSHCFGCTAGGGSS